MENPDSVLTAGQRVWNNIMCGRVRHYLGQENNRHVATIVGNLIEARMENERLRRDLTKVKLYANTLGQIQPTILQPEPEVDNDEKAEDVVRSQWLADLTWDEITTAALALADRERTDRIHEYERLLNLRTYPQLGSTTVITADEHRDLLHQQAYVYYNHLMTAITEAVREAASRRARLEGTESQLITELLPSQWFLDFLATFSRAERIGPVEYPRIARMDDVMFRTVRGFAINAQGASARVQSTFFTVPVDVVIQLPRFAQLFADVPFHPMPEDARAFQLGDATASPTLSLYKDFELLVHYGLATTQNYRDFLVNPRRYLAGDRLQDTITAVADVAKKLFDTFPADCHFKPCVVPGGHGYGLEFVKNVAENTQKQNVPDKIMSVLRGFILENIQVYKRKREMSVYGGLGVMTNDPMNGRVQSPIGRKLNFDRGAVAEFTRLYKRISPDRPNVANAQFDSSVAQMVCVHSLYGDLMTAALAIIALRHTCNRSMRDATSYLFQKAIYVNENVVRYASTLEVLPGLIFYTMLGAGSRETNYATRHTIAAGQTATDAHITNAQFFAGRPDRVTFYNTFAAYSQMLPTITEAKLTRVVPGLGFGVNTRVSGDLVGARTLADVEDRGITGSLAGVRWLDDDLYEQLRSSLAKSIQTVRSAYINIIMHTIRGNMFYGEQSIWHYFSDCDGISTHPVADTPLTTPLNLRVNYIDKKTFFNLPLVFRVRSTYVDASRFTQHLAGPMSGIDQQELLAAATTMFSTVTNDLQTYVPTMSQ